MIVFKLEFLFLIDFEVLLELLFIFICKCNKIYVIKNGIYYIVIL